MLIGINFADYLNQPITAIFLLTFLGILLYCADFFKKHLVISTERHLINDEVIKEIKTQLLESVSSIITLASGALLLGLSFLVFQKNEVFIYSIYALFSWLLFVGSIIFGILFRVSLIKFFIKWKAEVEKLYKDGKNAEGERKQNEVYIYLNKYTFNFEAFNIISFLVAVIFLAIFVTFNFYK